MNFEEERYVRLYVRDTPTWRMWRWEARALLPLLLRKLDKDGRIEWSDRVEASRAVSVLVDVPVRVVEAALGDLADSGTITLRPGLLEMPRFVPGQNARSRAKTPAERTAEWKAKTGYKHRQESPGDIASPGETAEPPSDPPAIPQPSDPPASPSGGAGGRRKPKASRQLDSQAELVLARIDEHRVRWGMPAISPSARSDTTILARLRDGATIVELLAGVEARARKADRDVSDRASLNATTPFTGPSANGPGGWSFTCQLLDRECAASSSRAPAGDTPEQAEIRRRYDEARAKAHAEKREKQRERDLSLRPKRPAAAEPQTVSAMEIPDDVA